VRNQLSYACQLPRCLQVNWANRSRQRGPLPQYKMKDTGPSSAIDSDISRAINCRSVGCSRLNAQVLKDRKTVSALTTFMAEFLRGLLLAVRPDGVEAA